MWNWGYIEANGEIRWADNWTYRFEGNLCTKTTDPSWMQRYNYEYEERKRRANADQAALEAKQIAAISAASQAE
jgi:hypothetical protein